MFVASIVASHTYELGLVGRVFLFLSRSEPYTSIPVNQHAGPFRGAHLAVVGEELSVGVEIGVGLNPA